MTHPRNAVLQANADFYEAFCSQDLAAMRDIWAPNQQVACIHPGWGVLEGWEQVMESWEGIFSTQATPGIRAVEAKVFEQGNYAFVVCKESVEGDEPSLVATNIFKSSEDGWKLVHHHVSPILQLVEELEEEPDLQQLH